MAGLPHLRNINFDTGDGMRFGNLGWATAAAVLGFQLAGCAEGTMGFGGPGGTPQNRGPQDALILSGTCNAPAGGYAIGRPATQALQSELITKTLAKTLRVLRPGEAVTQEFSSQRLNLEVDGTGHITAVRCG
ncbi:hypothetical protein GN316_19490 [Xylophilus sp. Kf1]|nr:hypothetical protein [Xylophilus sp. Kf1]